MFRIGSTFFQQNIPSDILFGKRGKWNRVPDPDPDYPEQIPHKEQNVFKLRDWTEQDIERLGIEELFLSLTARPPSPAPARSTKKVDPLDGVS